jgi:hypothetical protein
MDESHTGIVLFIMIGCLLALICHFLIKPYWKASITSAFGSSLVFCIIAQLKEADPFILIAFGLASFYGFIISAVIGCPFLLYRNKETLKNKVKNSGFPIISPKEMGRKKRGQIFKLEIL